MNFRTEQICRGSNPLRASISASKMRKVHFYKAPTTLGINNFSKKTSYGVKNAPDKILSKEFLSNFKDSVISSFEFKYTEEINSQTYYQEILNEYLKFEEFLNTEMKNNQALVVVGGDHSITFPTILFELKKYGKNLGIIHFDSHGDINLFKNSPSKNFHGMYLRILFDKFDLPDFDKTVREKLPKSNLFFIGDLELDQEEFEFVKANGFPIISSENYDPTNLKSLKNFVKKFSHIHISFDVDVFNQSLVSATTTPSKNGFSKEPILKMLDVIKSNSNFSLSIAEVNPRKEGAGKTIKLTQEIILKTLN